MHDEMPTFTSDELLQLARSLRSEIRRSGLDYRVVAVNDLVNQLTEVCLREASTGGRIAPVIGDYADEPVTGGRLVAQL